MKRVSEITSVHDGLHAFCAWLQLMLYMNVAAYAMLDWPQGSRMAHVASVSLRAVAITKSADSHHTSCHGDVHMQLVPTSTWHRTCARRAAALLDRIQQAFKRTDERAVEGALHRCQSLSLSVLITKVVHQGLLAVACQVAC